MLIERGVNIHYCDSWGFSPICDDVQSGPDTSTLQLLIQNGAIATDTVEGNGNSLLHLALNGFRISLESSLVYQSPRPRSKKYTTAKV
jgi:hypothetical protein